MNILQPSEIIDDEYTYNNNPGEFHEASSHMHIHTIDINKLETIEDNIVRPIIPVIKHHIQEYVSMYTALRHRASCIIDVPSVLTYTLYSRDIDTADNIEIRISFLLSCREPVDALESVSDSYGQDLIIQFIIVNKNASILLKNGEINSFVYKMDKYINIRDRDVYLTIFDYIKHAKPLNVGTYDSPYYVKEYTPENVEDIERIQKWMIDHYYKPGGLYYKKIHRRYGKSFHKWDDDYHMLEQ